MLAVGPGGRCRAQGTGRKLKMEQKPKKKQRAISHCWSSVFRSSSMLRPDHQGSPFSHALFGRARLTGSLSCSPAGQNHLLPPCGSFFLRAWRLLNALAEGSRQGGRRVGRTLSGQHTLGGVSCSPCPSPFPKMEGSLSSSSAVIKWSESCGF